MTVEDFGMGGMSYVRMYAAQKENAAEGEWAAGGDGRRIRGAGRESMQERTKEAPPLRRGGLHAP